MGEEKKSGCGDVCLCIFIAVFISMFIQSCVWADFGSWVHYDDQACVGGTLRGTLYHEPRWERGRCEVLSSGMKEKTTGYNSRRRRYKTYYLVHHQVRLNTEDGASRHVARAYKAPAWARGPGKLQSGTKYRRMFTDEDEAKSFQGRFSVGSTHKCHYNPSDPQEVSWRCRDQSMRVKYAVGASYLAVVLALLGIFVLCACLAGSLG